MMARAWRLRTAEVDLPAEAVAIPPGPALPSEPGPASFFPTGESVGYHTAMEVRFVSGGFTELGPATAWLRMRQPLVGDEPPSPLQRVLVAADVGNGISAAVDFRRFVFVNVDLTVQLERLPEGEWVCVDAVTLPAPPRQRDRRVGPRRRARPLRPRAADPARRRALSGLGRRLDGAVAAVPGASPARGAPAGRRPRDARDVRRSRGGGTGTARSRTSVIVLPESEAGEARSVTKMPGTSHFPSPEEADLEALERAACFDPP